MAVFPVCSESFSSRLVTPYNRQCRVLAPTRHTWVLETAHVTLHGNLSVTIFFLLKVVPWRIDSAGTVMHHH
jgi:hypothetical protein